MADLDADSVDMPEPVAAIQGLFAAAAMREYLGEPVSLRDHMLQAAAIARDSGAPDHLVVAALLHDVGHISTHGSTTTGVDGHHEQVGADWLARWFPPGVTEPIRLHVAAKRYLCAVEPRYLDGLSAASLRSLAEQGGPMRPDEVRAFEAEHYAASAVAVRRWDDAAKDPSVPIPSLDEFRSALNAMARHQPRSA